MTIAYVIPYPGGMPVTFAELVTRDRAWTLDAFVDEVNRILPDVVPDGPGRAKAEVNARLVRHYATEGVLPKPLKEGAEARYDSDHLVRLLALRRLLAEGYPSAVAGTFLQRHDRERLARFLLGELLLDLDLAPGGPPAAATPTAPRAWERLRALRERAGLPPLAPAGAAPGAARGDGDRERDASSAARRAGHAPLELAAAVPVAGPPASPHPATASVADAGGGPDATLEGGVAWTRYPLLTGLELHVRGDFVDPTTPAAWNALRDAILARLEAIALERATRR